MFYGGRTIVKRKCNSSCSSMHLEVIANAIFKSVWVCAFGYHKNHSRAPRDWIKTAPLLDDPRRLEGDLQFPIWSLFSTATGCKSSSLAKLFDWDSEKSSANVDARSRSLIELKWPDREKVRWLDEESSFIVSLRIFTILLRFLGCCAWLLPLKKHWKSSYDILSLDLHRTLCTPSFHISRIISSMEPSLQRIISFKSFIVIYLKEKTRNALWERTRTIFSSLFASYEPATSGNSATCTYPFPPWSNRLKASRRFRSS